MSRGYSLTAWGARYGVTRDGIHGWQKAYPEFADAVCRGKGSRLLHWETKALDVAETGGNGSQATMIIFGLKNVGREEWQEKQVLEHEGKLSLGALIESSIKTINPSDAQTIDHDPVTAIKHEDSEKTDESGT